MPEFCHNITPVYQPKPNKNPQGDCFACALTAALSFLFPENPPNYESVWNYFMQKYYNSDKEGLYISWCGMKKALEKAKYEAGYSLDITYDIVRPEFENEEYSHAWFRKIPFVEYTRRLEGWLRSGWVAFSEIDMHGNGPYTPEGRFNETNHYVILDGIKEVWEPFDDGEGAMHNTYIHVVCSVNGVYWIKTRDLLIKHGSAGWWLCRRSERY